MTDEQQQNTSIPWYQSKVIQRLALSIIVQVLAATHLTNLIASADLALLVDDLLEAVGIAYAAWAIHARVAHPSPPIVATQKQADIVNNTVSVPSPEEKA